jgi:outer membrane autotransporter protein
MDIKKIASTALMGAILSFGAVQSYAENKSYIGVGFGSSEYDTGVSNLTGTAALDEDDSAFKIFYGFNVTPRVAIEIHYADFGEASLKGNNGDNFDIDSSTFSFTANSASIVSESSSFGVSSVFKLFDKSTFNPYLKAGIHRWEVDATVTSASSATASVSDDGFDGFLGLGVDMELSDSFVVRVEYETYKFDSDDASVATLSARFVF